ncbi:MAG TPA: YqaA family protein [Thermodesulfobacteriota bacterium]|nr:YqaA family protein [Thermodesulfobacteriota bacterium]
MNIFRRLYDWVLSWAHTPYGIPALFILAFVEAVFFPIPPDVLLIALCVALPAKSFRYAAICSAGSVLGGIFGYLIGLYFMDTVGYNIVKIYGLTETYVRIKELYSRYDAWAVAVGGFTPIPYKAFTISAGAFRIDFVVFLVASVLSRSARFFMVAGLIYRYGPSIKKYIDKYFNIFTFAFIALLLIGFLILGGVLK